MSTVISVENVSKAYRLGMIGGATLKEDFSRWWAKACGRPDPMAIVGEEHHARRIGEQFWALQDVSFEVEEGEVLGVIGSNGAGKSTLLKILSQVAAPTNGEIKVKGRIASLLEVGTGFHPELSGRENIFLNGAILGMTKTEIRRKFDEIVAFSGIEEFIDTPVKRYSSGMYVRLAFAVAAHLEPEILIVDEVLAVGDASFQRKCLDKMGEVAHGGRTVIFVSHNMEMVKKLCQRGVLLTEGKIQCLGPVEAVVDAYVDSSIPPNEQVRFEKKIRGTKLDISNVRFLGKDLRPLSSIGTWSSPVIEIAFDAIGESPSTSIFVRISSASATVITLCSTQPDENLDLPISLGRNLARLHLPKLPLAAGEYVAEIGIAITNVEVVSLVELKFSVQPTDVFKSGTAPSARRYQVVVEHHWELGVEVPVEELTPVPQYFLAS
jgi:lipopolysaccharide transport system ATP-binding protein